MRYYLFLNSFRKILQIGKVCSTKLAVPRYMSTSVLRLLVKGELTENASLSTSQSEMVRKGIPLIANFATVSPKDFRS